jgi:peptidoglycan hydrolase-like protein with peptidoglycan-binding domain
MQLRRLTIGTGIAATAAAAIVGLGAPSALAVGTSWHDANSNGQIDKGDSGEAVRCVQRAVLFDGISVGGGADGQFGPNTKNGVLAYQSRYNLGRDGMVGTQTGGKMVAQVTSYSRTAHQTGGNAAPFDAWLGDCVNRYNNNQGQSIFHH